MCGCCLLVQLHWVPQHADTLDFDFANVGVLYLPRFSGSTGVDHVPGLQGDEAGGIGYVGADVEDEVAGAFALMRPLFVNPLSRAYRRNHGPP